MIKFEIQLLFKKIDLEIENFLNEGEEQEEQDLEE